MPARHLGLLATIAVLGAGCVLGGCSSSSPAALSSGLVAGKDLPGIWHPFRVGGSPAQVNVCNQPLGRRPKPEQTAKTAWAVSPEHGPIFGERIERYAPGSVAKIKAADKVRLPCDFTATDGSRWRTVRRTPPIEGTSSHVYLVSSRDRSDRFNYEVGIRSGDTYLLAVMNSQKPDRAELDRLVKIAWTKAQHNGLVH